MKYFLKRMMLLLLILPGVLLISPSVFLSQAADVWTNLELYGGQVYDIAIDPSNSQRMFAACHMGDGLYLTEDGGAIGSV